MASSPRSASTDFTRISIDDNYPNDLVSHPLDPAASFVYIDAPKTKVKIETSTSASSTSKASPPLSLEDGWDFVETHDDHIDDMTFTKVPSHSPKNPPKTVSETSTTSGSAPRFSRQAASMPPLTSSNSSRPPVASSSANHLGIPSHEHDRSGAKSKKRGPNSSSSQHRSTELTQNSGFKHRIYCTLYNLYHAPASEAPLLSNSPVFMMGSILQPNSDTDQGTKSASTSPTSPISGSPRLRHKTGKHGEVSKSSRDDFLEMCRTLLYFSYRKDFTKLEVFNVTSDVGWGCMLRTGQMLLATALQRLHEPLISKGKLNESRGNSRARVSGNELLTPGASLVISQLILDWFRDYPDLDRYPYSIHNLVGTSLTLNPPGEAATGPSWFSPTKLARILRFLVRMHSPENMTMYVPPEGSIYVDEVVALCTEEHRSTISPSTINTKNDRTMQWWQRFSAGGPAVSRTLTLAYEGSDSDVESEPSLDVNDIENDALYQRALAESLAQEEMENDDLPAISPAFLAAASSSSSSSSSPSQAVMKRSVDDSLLAWTVREWKETTADDGNGLARHPEMPTTSVSAPPGRASLSASAGAVPRYSADSTNSIDSSIAWVHLPIVRADLGNDTLTTLGDERAFDSEYAASPSNYSAHNGPLNLSALVEIHEDLQGEPKAHVRQLHEPAQPAGGRSRGNSANSRPHSPVPGHHLFPPSTTTAATPTAFSGLSTSPNVAVSPRTPSSSPGTPGMLTGVSPAIRASPKTSGSPAAQSSAVGDDFVVVPPADASSKQNKTPSVVKDFWKPLLLLIPSRLGVSKINPVYIDHLKFSLSSASSVGIVGGKPNKSLYFFAYQDDFVFYLDPHFVHNTVKPIDNRGQIHDSYKVKFPSKIKFSDLDPSLAIGFFLRTRSDFEAFLQAHHTFAVQCQGDPTSEPIFTIQDSAPDYLKA